MASRKAHVAPPLGLARALPTLLHRALPVFTVLLLLPSWPSAAAAAEPPEESKIGEREWDTIKSDLASKDPIEQMQFSSSNLDEGLYDFGENELYLSFLRDEGQSSLYAYVDVPPSEWSALANAGSHGGCPYDNIRLEYPYIEVTNFHDRLPEGPTPDAGDVPDDVPSDI